MLWFYGKQGTTIRLAICWVLLWLDTDIFYLYISWSRFKIKTVFLGKGISTSYNNKMVVIPPYLYNENSITAKTLIATLASMAVPGITITTTPRAATDGKITILTILGLHCLWKALNTHFSWYVIALYSVNYSQPYPNRVNISASNGDTIVAVSFEFGTFRLVFPLLIMILTYLTNQICLVLSIVLIIIALFCNCTLRNKRQYKFLSFQKRHHTSRVSVVFKARFCKSHKIYIIFCNIVAAIWKPSTFWVLYYELVFFYNGFVF